MNFVEMSQSTFRLVVESLVEREMDLTQRDMHGATILHHASWNGHLTLVKELVEEHYVPVSAMDIWGRSPRSVAQEQGHGEVAAYLEGQGG